MKIKIPTISKNKILLIALVVVGVAGFYLFKGKKEEPLTTAVSGGTSTISQELIVELNRLKTLQSIGMDIFKDPAFNSLQDYTQAVVPQPIGRNNPFAPLGNN